MANATLNKKNEYVTVTFCIKAYTWDPRKPSEIEEIQSPPNIKRGTNVMFIINKDKPATVIMDPPSEWKFVGEDNTEVIRPLTEQQKGWDRWYGIMVTSGRVSVKWAVYDFKEAVMKTLELKLDVKVVPREEDEWKSKVTLLPDGSIAQQPHKFSDLGIHDGRFTYTRPTPITISEGPNSGFRFIGSPPTINFSSKGSINAHLLNSGSNFSKAQDKGVYLTKPPPIRIVDPNLYDLNDDLEAQIKADKDDEFHKKYGIRTDEDYFLEIRRILHADLLTFTRRHEYAGDGNSNHSHRSNFQKAVRALDPKRYAESLVSKPKSTDDLAQMIKKRADITVSDEVLKDHYVIDEAATKKDETVRYVSGEEIFDLNKDDKGKFAGNVWDPSTEKSFQS